MLNLQQTQYEHVLGGVASVPLDSRLGAADPTVNTVLLQTARSENVWNRHKLDQRIVQFRWSSVFNIYKSSLFLFLAASFLQGIYTFIFSKKCQ